LGRSCGNETQSKHRADGALLSAVISPLAVLALPLLVSVVATLLRSAVALCSGQS
jgi:hypothetical protein